MENFTKNKLTLSRKLRFSPLKYTKMIEIFFERKRGIDKIVHQNSGFKLFPLEKINPLRSFKKYFPSISKMVIWHFLPFQSLFQLQKNHTGKFF